MNAGNKILLISSFPLLVLCDKSNWDDIKVDCGECKALIQNWNTRYKTCENYCETVGMVCLNAYEESNNDCVIEKQHACNEIITSSDAICECRPGNDNGKQLCEQFWTILCHKTINVICVESLF